MNKILKVLLTNPHTHEVTLAQPQMLTKINTHKASHCLLTYTHKTQLTQVIYAITSQHQAGCTPNTINTKHDQHQTQLSKQNQQQNTTHKNILHI